MKRCPNCNAFYEDQFNTCPTCGGSLYSVVNSDNSNNTTFTHAGNTNPSATQHTMIIFEEASGTNVIINGAVTESSTQQYYQSKFSKFFHALFSGEPYQLSHTTFVTIFRVEEHAEYGYPEQARDITLYGNAQNIFAIGDDVTVTARNVGNRLVARKVFNHSINSTVHIQPNIPASVIRAFMLIAVLIVEVVVYKIATIDYAAVGSSVGKTLMSCFYAVLPTIIVIWVIWILIRSLFSSK